MSQRKAAEKKHIKQERLVIIIKDIKLNSNANSPETSKEKEKGWS
jgi:hypothetical protein